MREFCHDYHVVAIDMRFACMLCVCLCAYVYVCALTCIYLHLHAFLCAHDCLCCRGYGETEKPPLTKDYQIQKLAQDIAQLVSFYTD